MATKRDWYRNTSWDTQIETEFDRRLARARPSSRPQYLFIQAYTLAQTHPGQSLLLLERFFAEPDQIHVSSAWQTRGIAYAAMGEREAAVAAYRSALEHEDAHPRVRTTALFDLAKLVALDGLRPHYDFVLKILERRQDEAVWPVQRYLLHGARALISHDLGKTDEARRSAALSLHAAEETHSGFRNNPTLGLVDRSEDEFGDRVSALMRSPH